MEDGWNQQPWDDSKSATSARTLVLQTSFDLDADGDLGGSELVLDGLWWKAEVELNGETLPAATGGNAPGIVALGEALVAGENSLQIRITPPTTESVRETGGWLVNDDKSNQKLPELRAAPRIELKPTTHIASLNLPLEGTRAQPRATVEGPLDGGAIQFFVALDGEVLVDLGRAEIDAQGHAQGESRTWSGPLWDSSNPSLVQLVGILEDASGQVIDTWARRVGVRQVETGSRSLELNGMPTPLMAARAVTQQRAGSLESRLQSWSKGGVNAIEIHGENAPEPWLSLADELGLPVIMLPRCIGRANQHNAVTESLIEGLEDQDRRLVNAMSGHPSVMLWMTEGPSATSRSTHQAVPMWTEVLLEDPQNRPVVDHDLGGRLLQVQQGSSGCNTGSCTGSWIAEITGHSGGASPWTGMSLAYLQAIMGEGALGGTIPAGQDGDAAWAQTWAVLATALGVKQVSGGPHRGKSEVVIDGLEPGQIGWLEAPWTTPVGGVADSDGRLLLQVWHSGEATVRAGDWSQVIDLEPSTWTDFSLESSATEVQR
jgi:hypothetical protein